MLKSYKNSKNYVTEPVKPSLMVIIDKLGIICPYAFTDKF